MLTPETEHRRVQEIVRCIDSLESGAIDPSREPHTRYALASLVRARSILLGISELDRAERTDVLGLLLRHLLEVWYYGLINLYGDQTDLEKFESDHLHYRAQLARVHDIEVDDGDRARFSVYARAERLDELLRERDPETFNEDGFATRLYDQVFRFESYTDVHAGVGALARYLRLDPESGQVTLVSEPVVEDDFRLSKLIQAEYWVALLAKSIWTELGEDASQFDDLVTPINEYVQMRSAQGNGEST